MNISKISKSDLSEITKSWAREYPNLTVIDKNRLVTQFGSLLLGICLELNKEKTKYLPIRHVHFLSNKAGFISLALRDNIDLYVDKSCEISFEKHKEIFNTYDHQKVNIDKYFLTETMDYLLIISDSINYFNDIKRCRVKFQAATIFDLLLNLSSICKQETYLQATNLIYDALKSWPDAAFRNWNGVENWHTQLIEDTLNQSTIEKTVKEEVSKLGLISIKSKELYLSDEDGVIREIKKLAQVLKM